MSFKRRQEIAKQIDKINVDNFNYETLISIFSPFDNNLKVYHADLLASSVSSVMKAIEEYEQNGSLGGKMHIEGLNDGDTQGLLHNLGTLQGNRIMSELGFSEEQLVTLKKMVVEIHTNKLSEMQDFLRLES